jgi:hypothetical protein
VLWLLGLLLCVCVGPASIVGALIITREKEVFVWRCQCMRAVVFTTCQLAPQGITPHLGSASLSATVEKVSVQVGQMQAVVF